MQLKIINNNESYSHVALSGSFDCEGVAEVFEEFRRNVTDRGFSAIVDMTEMDFISSLGLWWLIASAQELMRHNARLILYNPQPFVIDEIRAAGLNRECPVTNDFGEAIRLATEQR